MVQGLERREEELWPRLRPVYMTCAGRVLGGAGTAFTIILLQQAVNKASGSGTPPHERE